MQIKVFISWILTMVMCYHILGYAVLFRATDWVHRSMMEQSLRKNGFAILKIPNIDLNHHPEIFMRLNDDEIFYDGNYYDVKNETSGKESAFFQVIKDIGESDWHQQLSEAQTNSDGNHSDGKSLKSNAKIFSPEWFSNFQFQFGEQNSLQHFCVYCDKNISNLSEEIFLPPPKI